MEKQNYWDLETKNNSKYNNQTIFICISRQINISTITNKRGQNKTKITNTTKLKIYKVMIRPIVLNINNLCQ